VTFLARGEHLAAMREHGLRVDSIAGDVHLASVRATDDPSAAGVHDVVLVATKAWQVPEAAESLRPLVGERTVVIGLQNGVEAASQLAAVLGVAHVAGGSCAIMSMIAGPAHIRHAGVAPRIVFGDLARKPNEACERLFEAFSRTKGVNAVLADDIHAEIWRKFLFIAPVSGVGAVTRAPLGVARAIPESRAMIEEAMNEIHRLAATHGVLLPNDATASAMSFLDSMPVASTASMQRDIMEGRPSELEAQNGAVVRLGAAKGVATPVHHFIYSALLPQERKARGEDASLA
jgi:2-dehydropantoate 2-reductase